MKRRERSYLVVRPVISEQTLLVLAKSKAHARRKVTSDASDEETGIVVLDVIIRDYGPPNTIVELEP